jgi:hypothetical protein
MFVVAFVAPELTLLFAAAQWKIAHDIVCKFGKRKSLEARAWNFISRDLDNGARKQGQTCHEAHDNGMCLFTSSRCFQFCY